MIRQHEIRSDQSGLMVTARVSLPCEPWVEPVSRKIAEADRRAEKAKTDRLNGKLRAERREKIRELAEAGATRDVALEAIPGLTKNMLEKDLAFLGITMGDRRTRPGNREAVLDVIRRHGTTDAATIERFTKFNRCTVLSWCKRLEQDGAITSTVGPNNRYIYTIRRQR